MYLNTFFCFHTRGQCDCNLISMKIMSLCYKKTAFPFSPLILFVSFFDLPFLFNSRTCVSIFLSLLMRATIQYQQFLTRLIRLHHCCELINRTVNSRVPHSHVPKSKDLSQTLNSFSQVQQHRWERPTSLSFQGGVNSSQSINSVPQASIFTTCSQLVGFKKKIYHFLRP